MPGSVRMATPLDSIRDRRDMPVGRILAIAFVGLVLLSAVGRLLFWTIPNRRLLRLYVVLARPLRRWGLDPRTVARRIGTRAGMRVLVVDAGDGATAQAIAQEVGESGFVEAIAPSVDDAERARLHYVGDGVANIRVVAVPLDRVPFADESFDAVCFLSAFGRSTDPRRFLGEAWRVLRPTGRFSASDVISDPAYCLRRSVERWGEAVGFESLEHFGNLLAYTVNFRKPLGGSAAG
jgi:SAM-dependent methyltransferase